MKTCIKCKESKPATNKYFYKSPQSEDGLKNYCKSCQKVMDKEYYKNRKTKTCYRCKIKYPATDEYYYRSPNTRDGIVSTCKKCMNKRSKELREIRLYKTKKKAPSGCLKCAKYNPRTNTCRVMKELVSDCWAFTTDKNWEEKVSRDILHYRGL